jgi:hypothetical protein
LNRNVLPNNRVVSFLVSSRVSRPAELGSNDKELRIEVGHYVELGAKQQTTEKALEEALIAQYTKSGSLTQSYLTEIFPDWRTGPYKQAFAELAQIAPDLANIDLKTVTARIAELQPPGSEVLEALGLKVPLSQITRWGTLLLLAVQFYFWLHLHELNSKINASAPGRDVAWVGVYRSRAAAGAMLVSACLVPAIALAALIRRMPGDLPTTWNRYGILCVTGLAAILGVLLVIGTAERLRTLRSNLWNHIAVGGHGS